MYIASKDKLKFREILKENRKNFVLQNNEIEINQQLLNSFQKLYFETYLIPANSKIALYYPLSNEASTLLLIKWLLKLGHEVFLPKIIYSQSCLNFVAYNLEDTLITSKFQVQEPLLDIESKSQFLESSSTKIKNIIIAPLLGFDDSGNRLGYGAGYYDKTLYKMRAQNKDILYLGLAYSVQKVKLLPVDQNDIPLDGIITESYYKLYK